MTTQNFKYCLELIRSDFYRSYGKSMSITKIIYETIKYQAQGQGYMLFFRLAQCDNRFVSTIAKIFKRHYSHKYCIDIGTQTKIGKGFYLGHGMCVVINYHTVIGDNVNISQFVTIGSATNEYAQIGNNVYIGPNVCIVGGVKIGNNVTIGAGAVVTKDIPDDATVAGVPAKILNFDNPGKYINNKYEREII